MNFARIYTKLATDDEHTSTQTEVSRSEPNAFPATATYAIPPEYEVVKVELVAGHGNTDLVVYVIDHGHHDNESDEEYVARVTKRTEQTVPDAEA
jgi:hypothetical protein